MTQENSVLVDREGAVTIVTINRPQVRNAVDGATAPLLTPAFRFLSNIRLRHRSALPRRVSPGFCQ